MDVQNTVFISYRRTNSFHALAVYQNLTQHGYDCFFDYRSIDSGAFDQIIINQIKACAHFIVILTPSAVERFHEPGDWLRREIETAIDHKRNVENGQHAAAIADYETALCLNPQLQQAADDLNRVCGH